MANLINLEQVSKTYGLKTLLDGVSLGVQSGDRIGIVGVNGGGKTTLLEVLTGIEPPDAGRVSHTSDLRMAVVTQRFDLPDELTIAQVIIEPLELETYEWASNAKVRDVLGGLGIVDLGLDTPVGSLSGGERRRLQLTRVLMAEPNVLLLDEPTNDLDIDTLQELESLLDSWPGTLVVISHDRYLIERIADNTYALFGDGKLTNLPGGIDEYLRKREEIEAGKNTGVINLGEKKTDAPAPKPEKKLSSQQEREITKKMNALERKMQKLEKSAAQINEKLAAAAEEVDTEAMTRLDTELKGNRSAYEDLEMEWLELGEKLEQ